MVDFEIVSSVAGTVAEILGSSAITDEREYMQVKIRGITRNNFAVNVKFMTSKQWRLDISHNGAISKAVLLEEMFCSLTENTEFNRADSKHTKYQFLSDDINELIEAAQSLREFIDQHDLGSAKVVESRVGVNFQGTQFARLKERGATISGMFGNLVCQASGMNLLMMQAEYYVDAGEIDGVEFAEDGSIISIYECQSGIHKGYELDDEHTAKILGSYLYDPEIIPTVRKVVVLAGAYSDLDLRLLKERAYELARRERAIELVALITTREGNRIGVERVSL